MNDDDKRCIIYKTINRRYNGFLILTKLEYEAGLIKEESTSELLSYNRTYTKSSS